MKSFWFSAMLACAVPMTLAHAKDCSAVTDQAAQNKCDAAELATSDKSLNDTYAEIVSRLQGRDDLVRLLKTSQLAWIQFRDAECGFSAAPAKGGSVYPALVAMCKSTLTNARVRQLEAYLNCEEGDMSCPVPPR